MSTAELAAFTASLDEIPAPVRTRLTQCLLDFIAVTAAGSTKADSSPAIRAAIESNGPATVIGAERGYSWRDAALLNGAFAHSLDFDDTNIASGLHPGAPVFAAALAVAEREDADADTFLTAAAAGYEVCCRVGLALGHGTYVRGFHPTAIAGIFGATAAGARIRKMPAERTAAAFGLAGSMAAGSMQYLANGSWNKRLHPGLAAQNALLALDFAAAGVTGAAQALEGRAGVLAAYTTTPNPAALTDELGTRWLLTDTGIKPYPACRLTHGAIDAALALRAKELPSGRLNLRISPAANAIVGGADPAKLDPKNSVDAQFSVYFQTAVALLDGNVDWSSYNRIGSPDVADLIKRIDLTVDDDITEAGAVLACGNAEIRIDVPSGEGLPWAAIEAKYTSLTSDLFDAATRAGILAWTQNPTGSLRALTGLLRP